MEINVLSLGAGVQSSTMLLMSDRGILPVKPDVAIFADTGDEPDEVYEYLEYLKEQVRTIPIIVHRERNIIEDLFAHLSGNKTRYANPPFFTKRPGAKRGQLTRICTKEYKIEMVERAIRRSWLGLKPRQRIPKDVHVYMWIGISTDEIERVKPSRTPWITRCHPLIDAEMSRMDCLRWIADQGLRQPPRSSCLICPYHSDSEWARLMANHKYRHHIIKVDRAIRNGLKNTQKDVELYLHRTLRPIEEVEFTDNGESTFAEECEGMCGL
jgi:hypothetical protein